MSDKDSHSPEVIARRFVQSIVGYQYVSYDSSFCSLVKQFYEMLSKNPSELYKFYAEQSYFLHCENSQVSFSLQCFNGA